METPGKIVRKQVRDAKRDNKVSATQASWARIKQEKAIKTLVAYLSSIKEMNIKVASSGVGKDVETGETIRLTESHRLELLSQNNGIDIALDYIDRQVKKS